MDHLNEHITLFVLKNLEKLTEEERETIRTVAERDETLRREHDERLGTLKNEIQTLQRARDARVDFSLAKDSCVLCMTVFGRLLSTGANCPSCHRRVCKACRNQSVHGKKWMCTLCDKEWELRNAVGESMPWKDNIPRISTTAFVLRSLLGLKRSLQLSLKQRAIDDGRKLPSTPGNMDNHIPHFHGRARNSEERFIAAHIPSMNIICSPKFRQSLHGPLRPLPAAKPKSADKLHRPTLADKITKSLHEAATLMHIHSEAIFSHTPPKSLHTPRRTHSSPEVAAVDARDAGRDPLVRGKLQTPPTDGNEESLAAGKGFLLSSGNAAPLNQNVGLVASTPRFICGSDPEMSKQLGAPKLDGISISTVGSGSAMEEQQVHIARETFGDIKLQVTFEERIKSLTVTVLACRNLLSLSKTKPKFPNPYVKLYLYEPHCERLKRKTETVKKSRNPTFAETVSFPAVDINTAHGWLHVAVCSKHGFFRRTKVLGETTLLITPELLQRRRAMWYPLNCSYVKCSGLTE
ncbi:uncharacterized protein LOC129585306 [Paramacrobiotus metropolitanus]|uniref:uncharacterized protein LOC129585306 n=1 Tax=Paramacrobiotus metropolitanus TaxID=2943436 RepID=UPI002445BF1E|nr:uncharacterized protein LOC129585306 [Paramacrobiotus metropolitanus]